MINTFLYIILLFSCTALTAQHKYSEHKEILLLMGSRFELTAVAETKNKARTAVDHGILEVKRIEKLISSWDSSSQTSEINRMAGISPVKVDEELFDLIHRAGKVSKLTHGAFDLSFAGIDWLYQFDKKEYPLPNEEERRSSVSKIDYKEIVLNSLDTTVFLSLPGSKISFGAIGKGYAANRAKDLMSKMDGVIGGLVNASGDLITWGGNGIDDHWKIQISDPGNLNNSFGWLNLKDMAIVTSGDYEKYFTSKGTRYSHIIDPRTGMPTTGIKSVTIICPDAELADALATSVFVLGKAAGLELVNKLKDIEGLVIDDENEVYYSRNLKLREYE